MHLLVPVVFLCIKVVVTHSAQGGKLSPVPSITKNSLTTMDGPASTALTACRLEALTSLTMEVAFSIPE